MWTKEALQELIDKTLRGYRLIVVANREPYIHRRHGSQIECIQPASGMVTAIDPIIHAAGGTWIAHGSGDADRATVDEHDHVLVPPENPRYMLRRVWLSKEQEEGYYYGLANEGLWPLCHIVFTRPAFDPRHWRAYCEVNRLFAQAVLEEAGSRPALVFIQDYHFGLLPRLVRAANPNAVVAQFWHIPWPNRETFRAFPWKEELLDGLLGNDLLGFHIRYHCQNFLDTVDRGIEAKVDHERFEITRGGRVTVVRPFPISIDFEQHSAQACSPEVSQQMDRWRCELGLCDVFVGVGIERLDYTKGIPERLRAIDLFLEQHVEYQTRVVFIQVAVPSRTHIPEYKRLENDVEELVEQINGKWGRGSWRPIVFIKQHQLPIEMMGLHRLAHFFVVSALHDGMNLVAKEFVASRSDNDGVLILSEFTGAARELSGALLVNPFSIEELAEAIHGALCMSDVERTRRMQRLREDVARNNIYRWAGKILSALLKFGVPEQG